MATVTRNTVTTARAVAWANTPGTPVYRHARRIGTAVKTTAKGLVGVDTGQLQRSIDSTVIPGPRGPVARISAGTRHALVHHEGHRVIRPVRASRLRFVAKSGDVVYAQRVRAVRGTKFLTRAVQIVTGKRPINRGDV